MADTPPPVANPSPAWICDADTAVVSGSLAMNATVRSGYRPAPARVGPVGTMSPSADTTVMPCRAAAATPSACCRIGAQPPDPLPVASLVVVLEPAVGDAGGIHRGP